MVAVPLAWLKIKEIKGTDPFISPYSLSPVKMREVGFLKIKGTDPFILFH